MAASPPPIAEVAPEDAPPKVRLALEPVAESIEDVATALHELAWLKSAKETADGALEQKIRLYKEESERTQTVKVGRSTVSYAERMDALCKAIVSYCEAHPEEIERDGKKTRKFTHGDVALRLSKLSVELLEGTTWAEVLTEIKSHGWKRFIRKKEEVNKERLVSEVATEKLCDEELQAVGLQKRPPANEVQIKVSQYTCEAPVALS